MMRDKDGFEQGKEFVLAHEIAHLSHGLKKRMLLESATLWTTFIVPALFAVVIAIAFPSLPFVALGAIGVGAFATSCMTAYHFNRTNWIPFWDAEEKKADLDAVKSLQNSQGGVYFFETIRQHNLKARQATVFRKPPVFKFTDFRRSLKERSDWGKDMCPFYAIDENGNNRGDKTHPPLTDRIDYLQKWQTEHSRRA
ncbi:MAG: M48 family metalloprotease [Rhabdochlamydiaceae bacterium]|jgi:Zn-dependent protease with chaperone function